MRFLFQTPAEEGLEPLWRLTAYWAVVVSFFTLPLIVLILHLAIIFERTPYQAHAGEFSYLWSFHRILAGLLAAMLGLNSWERKNGRNGKNGDGKLLDRQDPKG